MRNDQNETRMLFQVNSRQSRPIQTEAVMPNPMSKFGKFKMAAALGAAVMSVAAGAASLSPQARLDKLLEGRVAGKPVSCINLRDIQGSEIIDNTAIVYRVGSKLYVNRPRGATQLDSDDILVTKTIGSQLCRIDVVRLVDRNARFTTGVVSLEDFVPYTKPKP